MQRAVARPGAPAGGAREAGNEVFVHVKVETGLNRFGVLPDEAVALAEALRDLPGVVVEGLAPHLARVDEGDKTFTFEPSPAFRACSDRLPWVPLHHVSSTGAVLDLTELRLALVRCGIGVYGYYPPGEVTPRVRLQPARGGGRRLPRRPAGAAAGPLPPRPRRLRRRRAPQPLEPRRRPRARPARPLRRPRRHGHAHTRRGGNLRPR